MFINVKQYQLSLLMLVIYCTSPCFADVHKWIDGSGKTHYGDVPPLAGTEKVRTEKETADRAANANRIRSEIAIKQAIASGKCEFDWFNNDSKGQLLAQEARKECLSNEALLKTGRSNQVRQDAYNLWKDHDEGMIELNRIDAINQNTVAQQQNAAAQSRNSLMQQNQSTLEQRELQKKLDAIEKKADDIRRTQQFGF